MTHDSPKPAKSSAQKKKTRTTTKKPADPDPVLDTNEAPSNSPPVSKKRWTLESGSLVVMQGDTQKYWKHEIPKFFAFS